MPNLDATGEDVDTKIQPVLYLVGFRFEPDIFAPQLYTIYVDGDRPIMQKGQPIVFTRPESGDAALAQSDCGAAKYGAAPTELWSVYDFTDAMYVLCEKDEAEDTEPLDCINLLLDIVNCTGERMPASYRKTFESLADHLTFNQEFKSFLESENIPRREISDAFYWALGMAAYRMKIITLEK